MGTKLIYLVRHGQEDRDNRPDEMGGNLSTIGIAQAQATAEYLRYIAFNAIYASTLRRADETVDIIAAYHPDVPVEKTTELWESVPAVPANLQNMVKDLPPEQILAEQQRIAAAFDRFFAPSQGRNDEQALIVCHGNLIRYFVCRVLDAPIEMWVNLEIANCGITRIEVRPNGRLVLVAHNEHQHIPVKYHTYI